MTLFFAELRAQVEHYVPGSIARAVGGAHGCRLRRPAAPPSTQGREAQEAADLARLEKIERQVLQDPRVEESGNG